MNLTTTFTRIFAIVFIILISATACTKTPKHGSNTQVKTAPTTHNAPEDKPAANKPVSKQDQQINIGDKLPLPDLAMKSTTGKTISTKELAKQNGLLVMFSCNTCPYVLAWEDRYPEISSLANDANIGFAVVNSNAAYRTDADSFDNMVAHAKEQNYDFEYLVDKNSTLADAYGATRTPDLFLFNSKHQLVYKGAIDDNYKVATEVQEYYIKDAIDNLLAGKPINPNHTKSVGCTIKRNK